MTDESTHPTDPQDDQYKTHFLLGDVQQDSSQTYVAGAVPRKTLSVLAGARIGNYEVECELGRGGMGAVFLAHHSQFRDRKYAIKLILEDMISEEALHRFQLEIDAIGRARHPNLLYALDAGKHENKPYLVTEFIDGFNLWSILKHKSQLPVSAVCEIGRQMALGLDFAHHAGIIHRDIKPANAMLQRNGQIKILDLGLASLRKENAPMLTSSSDSITGASRAFQLSSDRGVVGTPEYMPPEQWKGGVTTPASDIYSLASTLFCLLTGVPPFPMQQYGSFPMLMQAHLELRPPRVTDIRRDVPREVANLLQQCLEKDPDQRPKSCSELIAVLENHASPINTVDLFPTADSPSDASSTYSGTSILTLQSMPSMAMDFQDTEEGTQVSHRSFSIFLTVFLVCLAVSVGSLILSYYGPGTTKAWSLRFDLLDNSPVSVGTGFAIESARAVIFLASVVYLGYRRYLSPLRRFFLRTLNSYEVWIARIAFLLLLVLFLREEFSRHMFENGAARGMVDWVAQQEPTWTTTQAEEVRPYRWYFGYSAVQYTMIFGGLIACPILQFLLSDLRSIRNHWIQFRRLQTESPNAMHAIELLHQFAVYTRQKAYRYVDTAGTLAMGVQFEYWIGHYTLSPEGYAFEVRSMIVVACGMLLILALITWTYSQAVETVSKSLFIQSDHRVLEKLNQLNILWFLKPVFLTRLSGLVVLSLIMLALLKAIANST